MLNYNTSINAFFGFKIFCYISGYVTIDRFIVRKRFCYLSPFERFFCIKKYGIIQWMSFLKRFCYLNVYVIVLKDFTILTDMIASSTCLKRFCYIRGNVTIDIFIVRKRFCYVSCFERFFCVKGCDIIQ